MFIFCLVKMNSLTDDAFPLFTLDNVALFPSGFTLTAPSLIARVISAGEFEKHAASIFENTGCFKRKRNEDSKRDFKEGILGFSCFRWL